MSSWIGYWPCGMILNPICFSRQLSKGMLEKQLLLRIFFSKKEIHVRVQSIHFIPVNPLHRSIHIQSMHHTTLVSWKEGKGITNESTINRTTIAIWPLVIYEFLKPPPGPIPTTWPQVQRLSMILIRISFVRLAQNRISNTNLYSEGIADILRRLQYWLPSVYDHL